MGVDGAQYGRRETGGAWVWMGLGREEGGERDGGGAWTGLRMEGKGREMGSVWV